MEADRFRPSTIRCWLSQARLFLFHLQSRRVDPEAAQPSDVAAFIAVRLKVCRKRFGRRPTHLVEWRCGYTGAIHRLLREIQGKWPPPQVWNSIVEDFKSHLVTQNLEARYIVDLCFHARWFLDHCQRRQISVKTAEEAQVMEYLSLAARIHRKKHWYWMEVHRRAVHQLLRFMQGEWPPGSTPSPRFLQFKAQLKEQRFSIHTIWRHSGSVRRFLEYLRLRGIELEAARLEDLKEFLEWRREQHCREYGHSPKDPRWKIIYGSGVRRFMRMIDPDWPPPKAPANESERFQHDVCGRYARWMSEVHGLAKMTVLKNGNEARQFLAWLGDRANADTLRNLSVPEIDRYVAWRMPGLRRATRHGICISMRSFLRYLHAESWIGRDLSRLVSGPPVYAFAEIPRAFTKEQVQSLLDAARADRRPSGVRDYAILMLLATYGIRAGEVLRLRLEDIDWRENQLRIRRSKTAIESNLPLVGPVGNAILGYLKHARPKTHFREVFLRIRAPHEPLRHGALFTIIGYRLKQAGIEVRGRRGAHAFRFARAASLLQASVPVKTIGDLLGHQSAESTGIYLRLAVDDLRAISLDIPGR
jgi:site-specific recombinase XerD